MIVVIQCAGKKNVTAGSFVLRNEVPVKFVARPDESPSDGNFNYAHPDDASDSGKTWRAKLLEYNRNPGNNPLGLLPAGRLYDHPVYEALMKKFGEENTFILSAGWGLIRSDFFLPNYDITFSNNAERYKRRQGLNGFSDFSQLEASSGEEIVFFGGKDYRPLFRKTTANHDARKTIFYNSKQLPDSPGCTYVRYNTVQRTNWHYKCALDFVSDSIPY